MDRDGTILVSLPCVDSVNGVAVVVVVPAAVPGGVFQFVPRRGLEGKGNTLPGERHRVRRGDTRRARQLSVDGR